MFKVRGAAAVLGLVLVLSGCGFIPMDTGEYLTDDGDGEAAVEKLAVDSLTEGIYASGVPGGILYSRRVQVEDCRRIYKTGNYVSRAWVTIPLREAVPQVEVLHEMKQILTAADWKAVVQQATSERSRSSHYLKAKKGFGWLGASVETPGGDEPNVLTISTSTACVKPSGEVIRDMRSREPDYFKDAS